MLAVEIVGGLLFGSIALVADGLHMSTHAGASFWQARSRRPIHLRNGQARRLGRFTSAIILAMIALLIGYQSIIRLFAPVPIRFSEAIPIAVLGLASVRRRWPPGH